MFYRNVQRLIFIASALIVIGIAPDTTQAEPCHRIAIIPKIIASEYYDALNSGIDEAAGELPDLTAYRVHHLQTSGIEAHSECFVGRPRQGMTKRDQIIVQPTLPFMTFGKDSIDRHEF